jgi:suppressor for copper-sensitivity B
MTEVTMFRFARVGAGFVLAALIAITPLAARAAASDWAGDPRASVRIVTATDGVHGDTLDAGVEFRYPAGWHGYWRTPGDTGIAPMFDWSASQNVAGASVSWPAPARLVVAGLQNGVYTGDFILPVKIRLKQPHEATRLALTLDYATCSNVCVPEHAALTLALPAAAGAGAPSGEAAAIASALRTVPGTPAQAGISVTHSSIEVTEGTRHLSVELRSSAAPFQAPDLFVEGAGAGLPAAPRVQIADHGHRARFTVDLPPAATQTAPLQLTVVDGTRAATFAGPSTATGSHATHASINGSL